MLLYRIAKKEHVGDLTGAGARINGGRWNYKGTSVIYVSESRSLAALELLVHLDLPALPRDLKIATIEIPGRIKPKEIKESQLPANWRSYPAPSELAEIGNRWASSAISLLLRVPSAIVDHEFNYLINPLHLQMKSVSISRIEDFIFDERLVQ